MACSVEAPRRPPPARSIVADVILTVDNRTARSLLVYLESGAWRDSLGVVPHGATRSFSMPSAAGDSTSTLHLEARARRTEPGVRSEAFHVSAGQQVTWTLDRTRSVVTMR